MKNIKGTLKVGTSEKVRDQWESRRVWKVANVRNSSRTVKNSFLSPFLLFLFSNESQQLNVGMNGIISSIWITQYWTLARPLITQVSILIICDKNAKITITLIIFFRSYSSLRPWTVVRVFRPFLCWILEKVQVNWKVWYRKSWCLKHWHRSVTVLVPYDPDVWTKKIYNFTDEICFFTLWTRKTLNKINSGENPEMGKAELYCHNIPTSTGYPTEPLAVWLNLQHNTPMYRNKCTIAGNLFLNMENPSDPDPVGRFRAGRSEKTSG